MIAYPGKSRPNHVMQVSEDDMPLRDRGELIAHRPTAYQGFAPLTLRTHLVPCELWGGRHTWKEYE